MYPTMLMPSQAFIAVKLDTTGRLERNLQVQNRGLLIDFISLWFYPLLVVKKLSIVVTPSITLQFAFVVSHF